MKRVIVLISCLLLSSCNSGNQRGSPALGGVATASALIVALPLIPVAEAYHAVSGDNRRRQAAFAELKAKLDPVYEARMKLIRERDPVQDATGLVGAGIYVILPSIPAGKFYPGLMSTPSDSVQFKEVPDSAHQDRFVVYLENLMSKDKLQEECETKDVFYSSQVYNQFLRTGFDYKERFNQEMNRLVQAK